MTQSKFVSGLPLAKSERRELSLEQVLKNIEDMLQEEKRERLKGYLNAYARMTEGGSNDA